MRAYLFDMDGTMIDSDTLHFEAFQIFGKKRGLEISHEYFNERIHGRANEDIFGSLCPGENAQDAADEKEQLFRDLAAKTEPNIVAGVQEYLKKVKDAGILLACVTNAPRANAEVMLAASGLDRIFPVLVIGAECTRAKPFPDPYLEAASRLGVPIGECVIFEDSVTGVRAGVAAGAPVVVGVTTQLSDEVLREAGATKTVANFEGMELFA